MAANERTIQEQFIQRLKETIPPNHSLVDEMADLLGVSTDSAYRRIRGETALTIDEVSKICSHYRIAFDYAGVTGGRGDSVTFSYNHLSDNPESFEKYLENIVSDLRQIKPLEKKEIIFAAEDVPIFHHFQFPKLSAFKLFYWSRSILNAGTPEGKMFEPSAVSQKMLDTVKEIYELYLHIPSIEIWSEDTLNSTLKQLEYYWESGLFKNKKDMNDVLDDIAKMIKRIEWQAAHSTKFHGEVPGASTTQNYTLYNSELMIGNNCVLISAGAGRRVYISHNTFNTMVTTNAGFCDETENWLKNLIKKSTPISGVSEKQRFRFFKSMNDKIAKMQERVAAEV
ncbi:MAG: hypothetical protein M3R17_00425 [Bacteroidota bacterium]|nr:hypothetical protein [Bacteroidota bacterium]